MAQQQPRWKCSSKFARTAQAHIAGARGARKADVTQVDLCHRRQIGVNVEVHLESGVFHAQIDVRALQEKPESSISALRRRDPCETELHYDATCGQAIQRNSSSNGPHKKASIQVVSLDPYRPALTPVP